MIVEKKRFRIILLVVAFLLLIPFVAMQFSDEVNWTAIDFVIAGLLLLGAGLMLDLVLRKIKNTKYQIIIIVAILMLLLLIWAELAVGISDTLLKGN